MVVISRNTLHPNRQSMLSKLFKVLFVLVIIVTVRFLLATCFGISWETLSKRISSSSSTPSSSSSKTSASEMRGLRPEVRNTPATPFSNCIHQKESNSTHCLPKFIIGGAMKCGTNEAGRLIALHPRAEFKLCPSNIRIPSPENGCDDDTYQGIVDVNGVLHMWESKPPWLVEGRIDEYLDRFPETDGVTTFNVDKSPAFLDTFNVPEYPQLVKKIMPGVKLVFTLCDPAERMASEYYHYHRDIDLRKIFKNHFEKLGLQTPMSFPGFVDLTLNEKSKSCTAHPDACQKIRDMYLSKGIYVNGIKDWLKEYSFSDLLILDMRAPPEENAKKMIEFAGLPLDEYPWDDVERDTKSFENENVANYKGRAAAWNDFPESMQRLTAFYKDANTELATLIQQDFPLHWNEKQQPPKQKKESS